MMVPLAWPLMVTARLTQSADGPYVELPTAVRLIVPATLILMVLVQAASALISSIAARSVQPPPDAAQMPSPGLVSDPSPVLLTVKVTADGQLPMLTV